ncbi:hypothetical protein [Mycobacterium sp. 1274761.0]|uniref:hypothetical protein n=1 Tax=Mycobacterium sp. 1274761.0 TaxID=1834077 RepID=UPI0007FBD0E1|nr:hypothetical protein [Mycobacterium sp. 1274761.0]OBK76271.1 hypothetical protein A5651_06600 [Mycobacterium sp. 1274761.0]
MTGRWFTGDESGLSFPADPATLRDGGVAFLIKAFQTPVTAVTRCEEVSGGSTGRKVLLDVTYREPRPDLHTELFVKFSRDFDDPVRDRGRTQMASEVTFASLSLTPEFPIVVPRPQFADYHRESGTGILITERIQFGSNGIERQYHKCLDYQMPRAADHYRALLTAIARLAGAHRSGSLPAQLTGRFPVDLRAAAVGEPPPLSPEKLARRVARLAEFAEARPGLLPASVRSANFFNRFAAEAQLVLERESAIWRHLTDATEYIALSHWNANVDNAWFWTDDGGTLRCGLMDWGCVSQLNVAMAIWGSMSGAETELWEQDFDEILELFCGEVHASGGPKLDPAALEQQVLLYVALMGITWLLDVPALIRVKAPEATHRTDPAIRGDEHVRAPLQMLSNVLKLWESRNLTGALRTLRRSVQLP